MKSLYQRDGAVVIRNLLSEKVRICSVSNEIQSLKTIFNFSQMVKLLKRGIERNLRTPTTRAVTASRDTDPGRFFEDFVVWPSIEEYRTVLRESNIAKVAAELTSSSTIRMFHDHLLVKEPGTIAETPAHQDLPYYNISGNQNVSFWIPVDPVGVESSPKFIAGTHTGPWFMPRTFMDKEAKWFPEGALEEIPDSFDESLVRQWKLNPGDAVAFHMLTVHTAAGVPPDKPRRRAWSVRLIGDDVVHAPRRWKTSPDFPTLNLAEGEPMGSSPSDFPLLWPSCEI